MCKIKVTRRLAIKRRKELADLVSLYSLCVEFKNYQLVV